MSGQTISVTDSRSFCRVDKKKLFSVNAGIPVEHALEQASDLLHCLESLIVSHGAINEAAERTALQYLAEMARALVDACQVQDPEFFAQAQARVKAAQAPKTQGQAAA
ncbi:MAG: DUF3077 domain-containing protein [Pseudomonas sp.]